MKTNSKIEKQLKKKKNPELVETIINCKKNKAWRKVGAILSGPRKKRINLNLEDLNKIAKEKERILVPGKILSKGDLIKKIEIIYFGISNKAKEKLDKAKIKTSSILEEIKKNPEAKNLRIIEK